MAIEPAAILPDLMTQIQLRRQTRDGLLSDCWTLPKPDANFLTAVRFSLAFVWAVCSAI
jgi:hypothetical protein